MNLNISPAHEAEEWPMPLEEESLCQPVLPFTPEILPPPFREWLQDIAHRMQCPLDYLAATAMVMTSSIVGASCSMRPKEKDSWHVIPNLWGLIIGPPSAMKTPSMSEVLRAMNFLEKQAEEVYAQAYQKYLAEEEVYQASLGKQKMKL